MLRIRIHLKITAIITMTQFDNLLIIVPKSDIAKKSKNQNINFEGSEFLCYKTSEENGISLL